MNKQEDFLKLSYSDINMLLNDYDELIQNNIEHKYILKIAFAIGKILGQNEMIEY